eukprot:scaffold22009_cov62-Phaeocystis_antarctica.AAC.3
MRPQRPQEERRGRVLRHPAFSLPILAQHKYSADTKKVVYCMRMRNLNCYACDLRSPESNSRRTRARPLPDPSLAAFSSTSRSAFFSVGVAASCALRRIARAVRRTSRGVNSFARNVKYGFCSDLPSCAAPVCPTGERGFRRRSRAQRRSPIVVRGRLLELRRRARPHLPIITREPAQRCSPHHVSTHIVRCRSHHPRRQRLELLVVPPLRLGHLSARLLCQQAEGRCHGLCPHLRARRTALLGLEVPLRGLHVVPRVVERCTEAEVRVGPVGPQRDGLAVGLGFSTPVILRGVPHTLSQQLLVLVARLCGVPGLPLRNLALPLLHHPAILRLRPVPLHRLVVHRVPLPSARVPRAVDAAPVRRRHLELDAYRANFVLLPVVAHL